MAGQLQLSIVVPAYNESERLSLTLAIVSYLEERGTEFELIFSDDGSTDDTRALMDAAAARDPRIRVVGTSQNRGKGRAIAEGVLASRGDLVLISDTDFSTPITELPKLEDAIRAGADVAIGSRAKRGSQVEVSQPFHRVLMGKTFNLIVQAVILPGLWDTQCGFKLIRGDVAREIFSTLRTAGFAYDVEVIRRARRQGRVIAEIPVRWINSEPTKVLAIRHSARMFIDVFKIRFGR